MLYWITEALTIDMFVFHEASNVRQLLLPEVIMHVEVVMVLILFSIYAQGIVNKHRRAEEAQARLASIVENSTDVIDSKTLGGTIISLNTSAEKLYVNSWFPTWLSGEEPPVDRHAYVKWTEY